MLTPIYVFALSAPAFTRNLISVGHIAHKHIVLFTREGFYLQDASAPKPSVGLIGVRGSGKLSRLRDATVFTKNVHRKVDSGAKAGAGDHLLQHLHQTSKISPCTIRSTVPVFRHSFNLTLKCTDAVLQDRQDIRGPR